MPWWNRRQRRTPSRARLQIYDATVASVQRFDLTDQRQVEALAKTQDEWQESVSYYADRVGEMKDSQRFVENSARRIRLFAAFQRDPDAEPIAVGDAVRGQETGPTETGDAARPATDFLDQAVADLADEIVTSFAARDGGQAALLARLAVNVFLVGEAVLVNRPIATTLVDGQPGEPVFDWEVRSRAQVRRSGRMRPIGEGSNQQVEVLELIDVPGQQTGVEVPPDAFMERIWRQHWQWSGWADSNCRAAVGTMEELDLLAKLARASIRSRLVAGMVLMPDELDFGDADQPASNGAQRKGVDFDRDLAEAFAAVISNEADANSVAPLGLRGKAEHLKEVRVVEFPRRYTEDDRLQYEEAVKRLGRTIDLPVERILGMSDVNHWTAWMIDEDTYEAYIEPLVAVMAEGLTYGLLRPLLIERGVDQMLVDRLVVAADPSQLVRRPDRGKVASEGVGLANPALGTEAWRRANGFGDDDAPSLRDFVVRMMLGGTLDTGMIKILAALGYAVPPELQQVLDERQAQADAIAAGQQQPGEPAAGGGDTGNRQPPAQPSGPQAVAAAAGASHERLVASMLGAADRTLLERLLVASDAAMSRALERAGARLRSRAQRRPAPRATLAAAGTVPNADVGRVLGAAVVAALNPDDDLFAGAFDDLHAQWDPWVDRTQAFATDSLTGFGLDAERSAEMRRQQQDDRDRGWEILLAALLATANERLTGAAETEDPGQGEFDDTLLVAPGVVRGAMATAGGASPISERFGGLLGQNGDPLGGVATGDLVRGYFASVGYPWSGYVWHYGDAALRHRPFPPHHALDGITFVEWNDGSLHNATGEWPEVTHWFPGDHKHCRCSWSPILGEAEQTAA